MHIKVAVEYPITLGTFCTLRYFIKFRLFAVLYMSFSGTNCTTHEENVWWVASFLPDHSRVKFEKNLVYHFFQNTKYPYHLGIALSSGLCGMCCDRLRLSKRSLALLHRAPISYTGLRNYRVWFTKHSFLTKLHWFSLSVTKISKRKIRGRGFSFPNDVTANQKDQRKSSFLVLRNRLICRLIVRLGETTVY